jgi:hypothetical protein
MTDEKRDNTYFVIKYTGENPVACLWDEAKIKK